MADPSLETSDTGGGSAPLPPPQTTPQANPYAGQSIDQLLKPPPGLMDDLAKNTHEKIERDEGIRTRMEHQLAQDESDMKYYRGQTAASINDIKKWDAKAESQKYAYDPIEAFGSFASVFAIAASAFTKAPMENALNGAAAAMNAVREGKDKEFDRAFKAFKENNELAIKRSGLMMQQYQTAMETMRFDFQKGGEEMKMSALKYGDQQALTFIEHGMSKELFEMMEARTKAAEGIERLHSEMIKNEGEQFRMTAMINDPAFHGTPQEQEALYLKMFHPTDQAEAIAVRQLMSVSQTMPKDELARKLLDVHRQFSVKDTIPEQIFRDWKDKHPDATPEEASKFYQTLVPKVGGMGGANMQSLTQLKETSPEMYQSLHDMAERWYGGEHSAATAFGIRDPRRAWFQEMIDVVGHEKNLTPEQIAEAGSQWQYLYRRAAALGTQSGRTAGNAATVYTEGDVAIQKSAAVPRGSFVPLNQLSYAAKRMGSNSALAQLDTAVQSLVLKYSATAGGDSKSTDSLREHAYQILNQAYSHETFVASVELLRNEAARMVAAPDAVRKALLSGKTVVEALHEAEKEIDRQMGPSNQPADVPKVTTKAEWDKLEPGTQYTDPSGTIRTKGQ